MFTSTFSRDDKWRIACVTCHNVGVLCLLRSFFFKKFCILNRVSKSRTICTIAFLTSRCSKLDHMLTGLDGLKTQGEIKIWKKKQKPRKMKRKRKRKKWTPPPPPKKQKRETESISMFLHFLEAHVCFFTFWRSTTMLHAEAKLWFSLFETRNYRKDRCASCQSATVLFPWSTILVFHSFMWGGGGGFAKTLEKPSKICAFNWCYWRQTGTGRIYPLSPWRKRKTYGPAQLPMGLLFLRDLVCVECK